PATGEVAGLRRLDLVDAVEHDHAFADIDGVVLEGAAGLVAAPDAECGLRHDGPHSPKRYANSSGSLPSFCSRMTSFKSAGISGMRSRRICMRPSWSFQTTVLTLPNSALFLRG